MKTRNIIILALWLAYSMSSMAAIHPIKKAAELTKQFPTAQPGDTFLLADGDYQLSWLKASCVGTPAHPIVVKAANARKARVVGSGCITLINAAYVVFDGLDFDMAATSSIFKLQGAHHIRITNNRFTMSMDKEGQTSKWILVGDIWDNDTCCSGHNRIDHNLFEDKLDGGSLLVIDGAHGVPGGISQHDTIDHNIFRRNTPRQANEKETIRIGVSGLSFMSSYTVVEYNEFEDCDGDPEIVSVKSCDNIVRHNIFRGCLGTVCLRQGFRNRVEYNSFYGENKTAVFDGGTIGTGGVRVYSKDHLIANNYMVSLTGSRWDAALTLTNGDVTNSSTSQSAHFLPENVQMTGNTIVDCVSGVEVGFTNGGKYGKKPKNCVICGNQLVRSPITYHAEMTAAQVQICDTVMQDTIVGTQSIESTPLPNSRSAEWIWHEGQLLLRMPNSTAYITLDGRIVEM